MPSGISHMLLSRKVLDHVSDLGRNDCASLVRSHTGLYLLGSVAPDLPYMSSIDLSFLESDAKVADAMHYFYTNEIPRRGFEKAREYLRSNKVDEANSLFAFYLGYTSHVQADAIIHPYVRDMVGDYQEAKTKHRVLEMKLDVLLAKNILNMEVNGSSFPEVLSLTEEEALFDFVCQDFAYTIRSLYPYNATAKKVADWSQTLRNILDFAEGNFPVWYRELLKDGGASYLDFSDIASEEPRLTRLDEPVDKKEKALQGNFVGRPVNFYEDVIPKYMETFSKLAIDSYDYVLAQTQTQCPLIPAVDLDTGRDLPKTSSTLSKIPSLWSVV